MTKQTQTNEKKSKPRLYFKREISSASALKLGQSIHYARSIPVLLRYLGGQLVNSEYREGTPEKTLHAPDFTPICCGSDYKIRCDERIDRYQGLYTFPEYPNLGLSVKTSIYKLNNNFYRLFTPRRYSDFGVTIGELKRPSLTERLKRTLLKKIEDTKRIELESRVRDLFEGVLKYGEITFSTPPSFENMGYAEVKKIVEETK